MTSATAPGKIILFGEHAVVYQRPALAVPVTQVRARVHVEPSQLPGIRIEAPDIHINTLLEELEPGHPLKSAVEAVLHLLGTVNPPAFIIRISSSIPVASGLGSGAAVSVALIRALSTHLGVVLSDEQVNTLCYEIEKIHHGTPSGIDNTVITYSRPVFFVRDHPLETFKVKNAFTIVIADTGVPAPTKEAVGDVRKLWQADIQHWDAVFDKVGTLVRAARLAIESGTWQELGPLMDANHALLQEMTVSSPDLDRLVQVARDAGALGAKLSGGGRGGNMIALVQPESSAAVACALLAAGARHTITTTIQ